MDEQGKEHLIQDVESLRWDRSQMLRKLGIPRSTYYHWKRCFEEDGPSGLEKGKPEARRVWNRLLEGEVERVLEVAKLHPELSPRLLAIKITDEEPFTVSESTVYRILKSHGLIEPRPLPELPSAREWRHKTRGPDEIWQTDGTNFFIVGWGYYKLISVEDDYSRKCLAWDLKSDETAFSISDVVEKAIEEAEAEGHNIDRDNPPQLLSDNGPGFASKVLAGYLSSRGIKHIFGKPYHPQTRGKIERFHKTIKERVCLMVYCSPEELKRAISEAIQAYNTTPHEALGNASPNDVYLGRKEEILKRRREKKHLTLEFRKWYNLEGKTYEPNPSYRSKVQCPL